MATMQVVHRNAHRTRKEGSSRNTGVEPRGETNAVQAHAAQDSCLTQTSSHGMVGLGPSGRTDLENTHIPPRRWVGGSPGGRIRILAPRHAAN